MPTCPVYSIIIDYTLLPIPSRLASFPHPASHHGPPHARLHLPHAAYVDNSLPLPLPDDTLRHRKRFHAHPLIKHCGTRYLESTTTTTSVLDRPQTPLVVLHEIFL